MNGGYLNVDLDVRSPANLAALIEGFGDHVIVLHESHHHGQHLASFELAQDGGDEADTAEAVIERFCALIEMLPPPARQCWDRCSKREFNIGYEIRRDVHSSPICIPMRALSHLIAIGADIGFTVYLSG